MIEKINSVFKREEILKKSIFINESGLYSLIFIKRGMYSFFLLDPNNALIFYVKTFCRIIIILFFR
jgi:hypothetical protein